MLLTARRAALLGVTLSALLPSVRAQEIRWNASVRAFQFLRVQNLPFETRRDTELAIIRAAPEITFSPQVKAETHFVLNLTSPPWSGYSSLASGDTRTLLALQRDLLHRSEARLQAAVDRLNLQMRFDRFHLVVGRQAISWGVNYFWPALDLFAPFAPQRIDRDYKPGVDAVRLIVPLNSYSEVQLVGAGLGSSLSRDGAVGALTRINLGSCDLGLMAGRFHRDTVAGAFLTADVRGTGLRAEVAWTQSGDPTDQMRRRGVFWRGSVGLDRQLSASVTLVLEAAWSEYGTTRPEEFPLVVQSDRFLRGEINAVGRSYSGTMVSWQFHPLWTVSQTCLVNWRDPSALWIPTARWSAGNNTEVLLGAEVGLGAGWSSPGTPSSEYGAIPSTLFLAFKTYF